MVEPEHGEMWYVVEWARLMAQYRPADALDSLVEHVRRDRWKLVSARRTLRSVEPPGSHDAEAIELLDAAIAAVDSLTPS